MDQVIQNEIPKIVATLGSLFEKQDREAEVEILANGKVKIEIGDDSYWSNGAECYDFHCMIPIEIFSEYENSIAQIEGSIKIKLETIFKNYPNSFIGNVIITPELTSEFKSKKYKIGNDQLLNALELQRSLMISVSTGGPGINGVNQEYQKRHGFIKAGLKERNISYKVSYNDLWAWYRKWSNELPTYQLRREFIAELYDATIDLVKNGIKNVINTIFDDPTGWERVDRTILEVKERLLIAKTEEQFQAIGLLCREVLISLAQEVYIPDLHKTLDGVSASSTDSKRMLEAYLVYKLEGKTNATVRRHAKSALELANELTHKRTADFKLAALCAESTNAVINIISIIEGTRGLEMPETETLF